MADKSCISYWQEEGDQPDYVDCTCATRLTYGTLRQPSHTVHKANNAILKPLNKQVICANNMLNVEQNDTGIYEFVVRREVGKDDKRS